MINLRFWARHRKTPAGAAADGLPHLPPSGPPWGYGSAIAAIVLVTILGLVGAPHRAAVIMPVAYLLGVLVVATRASLGPALAASILGFLAFNLFFLEPRYTLQVNDPQDILALFVFLIAAGIVSKLTTQLRAQILATREGAQRIANLYDFNRKMSSASSRDDVHRAITEHLAATVRGAAALWLPAADGLAMATLHPPQEPLRHAIADAAVAAWRAAGAGDSAEPSVRAWRFHPLMAAQQTVGVLGLRAGQGYDMAAPEDQRLVNTLVRQSARAIERTNLVAEIEAARQAAEREELRSALLSSLSHDLRTPLVSILLAATSLSAFEEQLDPENRKVVLQTIEDEAQRLNHYVQNLLDMTRVSADALQPKADWVDLHDILAAAAARGRRLGTSHVIDVENSAEPILLYADPVLMEQMFFNLLDNSCKYAPAHSVITISTKALDGRLCVTVTDQGPGIAADHREKVFDTFYRVDDAESTGQPGTGLGLAICRGIVTAHGGTIRAEAPAGGIGLAITVELPQRRTPPLPGPEPAVAEVPDAPAARTS